MRLSWVGPASSDWCPYKKRRDTETRRGPGDDGRRWETTLPAEGRREPLRGREAHRNTSAKVPVVWSHPAGGPSPQQPLHPPPPGEAPGRVAAGAGAPAPSMCRSGKPPGLPRVRGSGRMAPFLKCLTLLRDLGVEITVCGGGGRSWGAPTSGSPGTAGVGSALLAKAQVRRLALLPPFWRHDAQRAPGLGRPGLPDSGAGCRPVHCTSVVHSYRSGSLLVAGILRGLLNV